MILIHKKVKDDETSYSFLRYLYRNSPEVQLKRMHTLYVACPTLSFKSHMFFTFGKELSYLKKKMHYLSKWVLVIWL